MELLKQKTQKNLFVRNETVTLETEGIDKKKIESLINKQVPFAVDDILIKKQKKYKICQYAGSGLAASVWKAVDLESDKDVALKIYNPRGLSGMIKKFLRNVAHLAAYQSPFPYRYIKEAVLANLVVGDMLASVVEKEIGKPLVARSQAVFFSPDHKSWGEVTDWIQGQNTFATREEKKQVLESLKRFREVAHKAGFNEHSYQVENRLGAAAQTFRNVIKHTQGEFFWVDRTPAMPIMLFLYPYHFAALIKSLRSGSLIPFFDKVNSKVFRDYIQDNRKGNGLEKNLSSLSLYDKLRGDYEASRLNLALRIASIRKPLRWRVKQTVIGHWRKSKDISESSAGALHANPLLFYIFALLDLIPFLGTLSRKLFLNADTWRHMRHLLWPVLGNNYRRTLWEDFKSRSIRKVTAWLLEDIKNMHDKGKISGEELHRFEEAAKTKEWLTYMWVLLWHMAGKIPGDLLAAGLGGYGLFTLIKMIGQGKVYFSGALALGLCGMLLPGIYRLIVTLIVAKNNPDVDFEWHWIGFCVIPTFGYLAMPLQIVTHGLSNKTALMLLYFKLRSNIYDLLDIIPGYRELDFYILSRARSCEH